MSVPLRIALVLVAVLAGTSEPVDSAVIIIGFDQDEYVLSSGASTFDVGIVIDGDDSTAGLQPVANGLLSYGWQMTFGAADASAHTITLEPALDFFGAVAPARTSLAAGLVRAKGNVDQAALVPFAGNDLATVSLTNLAPVPSTYLLSLAIDPAFGSEDIFIDGIGTILDGDIVFGTARVVVPEPSGLVVMAVLSLAGMRRMWVKSV